MHVFLLGLAMFCQSSVPTPIWFPLLGNSTNPSQTIQTWFVNQATSIGAFCTKDSGEQRISSIGVEWQPQLLGCKMRSLNAFRMYSHVTR